MKYKIGNINPIDFSFFIGGIEFFALFLMGLFIFNFDIIISNTFYGFPIGFFGTFMLLIIFNYFCSKTRYGLRLSCCNEKKLVKKVEPWSASIIGGIFLFILFVIQSYYPWIPNYGFYYGRILMGFFATFVAVIAGTFLYNYNPLKFRIWFGDKLFILNKVSVLKVGLFVSFMEAMILPIMFFFLSHSHSTILYAFSGFFAGAIAAFVSSLCYNRFAGKRFQIEFSV
ncbi:hypothetical protein HN412_03630 [archaeon]|nr:hypothetical protein [archaeon]MBT7297282.1 hypothetical protein [archaeon]